jgi:16S rRNA processing protein RimM
MDEDKMITVGKVRDAHGLKGELFIILFAGQADWIDSLTTATLVRNERVKVGTTEKTEPKSYSFPVKRFKVHKKGLILKLDGIADRTEAESFGGALLQIPNEYLESKPGEKIFLKEIEGFEVEDKKLGVVGKVAGFSSNGAQDLLIVQSATAASEVPLVPEFIETLDFKNRRLKMDLPEGLITGADS